MTPETIIRDAGIDGVNMSLAPEKKIRLHGNKAAVKKWTPTILDKKLEIITVLQAANDAEPDALPAEAGRRMLEELAQEFNHPLRELLEWYAGDLEDFATIPKEQARRIVADHIGTRLEALPDAGMEKRRQAQVFYGDENSI